MTMTDRTSTPGNARTLFPLSQETLAVLAVGATLLTTVLVTTGRLEDRIDRYRVEAREDREALRAEAREDRRAFARQIVDITREQAHLSGLVEGLTADHGHPE